MGGGHNGVTCVAYLARAGPEVLALERRHIVGGPCGGYEFFPGCSSPARRIWWGDWSTKRERFGEHCIDVLTDYKPTLKDEIIDRRFNASQQILSDRGHARPATPTTGEVRGAQLLEAPG